MENIITKDINSLQFVELKATMYSLIRESINALENNGGLNDKKNYLEHLAWYKDCEMSDYFAGGFEEIFDENDKVFAGLNTIAYQFVLNEDTRTDFESAFEQARDEAYEIRLKEIAEEIEDIEDEEIESIESERDLTEEEGARIAYDSSSEYTFYYPLLQEIYDKYCLDIEKIAVWAGANVCISNYSEDYYTKMYYRVENNE